MPSRPDLRRSLGREAIYGANHTTTDEAEIEPTEDNRKRWEELHRRATYHLPLDLQQAIAEEADRSGRSKSRVVTDALRAYLQVDDRKRSTVNGRR